jgi:hypothetical protein
MSLPVILRPAADADIQVTHYELEQFPLVPKLTFGNAFPETPFRRSFRERNVERTAWRVPFRGLVFRSESGGKKGGKRFQDFQDPFSLQKGPWHFLPRFTADVT